MKILHISPSYKPAVIYGGPTVSVSQLCEWQAKLGHEVMVYTTTANGDQELDVPVGSVQVLEGVKVFYYDRLTKDHTHFSPSLLKRIWQTVKSFDAVHIHSWWNLVAVFAALICWLRNVKPVLSPRGMLSSYSFANENSLKKKAIHGVFGKLLLPKTVLHATTPMEVRDCQQVIADWEHFVAPNIIPLPVDGHYNNGKAAEGLQLIFLSRIDPKKGMELLFEALAQASVPFNLKIYGSGDGAYIQSLKKLAQQLGIDNAIDWMGWADKDEKYRALSRADLFVLTSYNENFANVVLESLAVGTPVLVSDKVGLYEYVAEKHLGVVTSTAVGSIVNSIRTFHQDLRKGFTRERLATTVRRDYNGEHVAGQYIAHYQSQKLTI